MVSQDKEACLARLETSKLIVFCRKLKTRNVLIERREAETALAELLETGDGQQHDRRRSHRAIVALAFRALQGKYCANFRASLNRARRRLSPWEAGYKDGDGCASKQRLPITRNFHGTPSRTITNNF